MTITDSTETESKSAFEDPAAQIRYELRQAMQHSFAEEPTYGAIDYHLQQAREAMPDPCVEASADD